YHSSRCHDRSVGLLRQPVTIHSSDGAAVGAAQANSRAACQYIVVRVARERTKLCETERLSAPLPMPHPQIQPVLTAIAATPAYYHGHACCSRRAAHGSIPTPPPSLPGRGELCELHTDTLSHATVQWP